MRRVAEAGDRRRARRPGWDLIRREAGWLNDLLVLRRLVELEHQQGSRDFQKQRYEKERKGRRPPNGPRPSPLYASLHLAQDPQTELGGRDALSVLREIARELAPRDDGEPLEEEAAQRVLVHLYSVVWPVDPMWRFFLWTLNKRFAVPPSDPPVERLLAAIRELAARYFDKARQCAVCRDPFVSLNRKAKVCRREFCKNRQREQQRAGSRRYKGTGKPHPGKLHRGLHHAVPVPESTFTLPKGQRMQRVGGSRRKTASKIHANMATKRGAR